MGAWVTETGNVGVVDTGVWERGTWGVRGGDNTRRLGHQRTAEGGTVIPGHSHSHGRLCCSDMCSLWDSGVLGVCRVVLGALEAGPRVWCPLVLLELRPAALWESVGLHCCSGAQWVVVDLSPRNGVGEQAIVCCLPEGLEGGSASPWALEKNKVERGARGARDP